LPQCIQYLPRERPWEPLATSLFAKTLLTVPMKHNLHPIRYEGHTS
jgi:hypothetical protein